MLSIAATERFTGACISGDYWDFEAIADAIDYLVGDENKYYDFQGARGRLMHISRLFRVAMRMERKIEYVPNGVNNYLIHTKEIEPKKALWPERNVYFAFDVLHPELIFSALALNDFIKLHEKQEDPRIWNIHIANARLFQALVAEYIKQYLPNDEYEAFLEVSRLNTFLYFRYATQYVDLLNVEFIKLDEEDRYYTLRSMIARLISKDSVYLRLKEQLLEVTNITKNSIHEIPINIRYPEEVEW